MKGVIKKLFAEKGFGFLTVEGRKNDLFFHASGLVNQDEFSSLTEGQEVTFEYIIDKGKGDQAVGISF